MGKRRAGWEHFEHMADVGVRGLGSTRAEALESAARTLIAAVADVDAVRPRKSALG
jgi:SHS2 domain-containing protein